MLRERRPDYRHLASIILPYNTLIQSVLMGLVCLGGAGLVLANWHTPLDAETTQAAIERFWILMGIGLWWAVVAVNWRILRPPPFEVSIPRHGIGLLVLSLIGVYLLLWLTLHLNPNWHPFGFHNAASYEDYPDRDQQLLILFGGAALFVVGMLRIPDIANIRRTLSTSLRQHRREWLLVIGLTAAALAVRFYKLDSLIPVLHSDEPQFYYPARRIADGWNPNLASNMQTDQTFLGAFIFSYSVDLFGPTLFACRAFAAVIGSLAIPGVYLAARRLFNPLAAALAALFLVAQPVHVHFSRTALYQPFDPTIAVYTALVLWSALERGERWKFALAGVLIGINQYFYTAGRLWLLIVPLWLVILFLRQPRPLLRHWGNLIILAAGVFVLMLPMIAQIDLGMLSLVRRGVEMSHAETDLQHVLDVTLRDYLFEWLSPAMRLFLDRGDESFHYELDRYTALNLRLAFLVFGLGLAYALRFALNPRLLLMLIWLGLTVIFGGSLMHYLGHTRYVTAMIPMSILAGAGVAWLAQLGRHWLPERRKPLMTAAALVLMLAVNVQDLTFILDKHPNRLLNDLWDERWIADALAKATLAVPHDDSSVIYWATATPAWNLRMKEVYGYYHGTLDYVEWNKPISPGWVASLDASEKDLYIFVPPIAHESAYNAYTNPNYVYSAINDPIYLITKAYPMAHVSHYDSSIYPASDPPALYSMVHIPRGSANQMLQAIKNVFGP